MLQVNSNTSVAGALVGIVFALAFAAVAIGVELLVVTWIMNLFGIAIPVAG